MANETPPLMANAILNFHFDFLTPSLTLLLLFFQPPESGKLCGGKYLLNTYQLSTIKIYYLDTSAGIS